MPSRHPLQAKNLLAMTLIAASLTACGGGGGGSGPDTVAPGGGGGAGGDISTPKPSATPATIEFADAQPALIKLLNMGGITRSTVTFLVKDAQGNPVKNQQVNFRLENEAGGLMLSTKTALTDANGVASTQVIAGNVATSIRVNAEIPGTPLQAQSEKLVISTGYPHQDGFSLAATSLNPEFLNRDGEETTLTASASDRAGNLVPDGTPIYFVTEAGVGQVDSKCETKNGRCSVKLSSSGDRNALVGAGRQTILAYTLGEESFSDSNGNGLHDMGEPFDDLPEAFVDANMNGTRNLGLPTVQFATTGKVLDERFEDLNANLQYDAKDDNFNGVTRNYSSGARTSVHIRKNIEIVWSGPWQAPTIPTAANLICTAGTDRTGSLTITPTDVNGNPVPSGSKVKFAILGSAVGLQGDSEFIVPNKSTPTTFTANYGISTGSDCGTSGLADSMLVTITTPSGIAVSKSYPIR
ncbi:Ig-like domain-containing protein [Craterilacuibacter sp. RT1T]|uniref:Ig-like domain-containing protein n=1 Tax=Craterilacuibacter sp. RT1T TaxID=2942211 RepID=UPI0020BF210A|nr:Ig-like domain-containing protein [Craterilacuibacter sp. RT1T]MCL6264095.1 Ig-like domain-containing protein [Craterilacuibacter sp. RT1T]